MLYFVGTPIGNLKDMSYRAVEVLSQVDEIACEDTRHSLGLLNAYGIKKPLTSYHKFNEREAGEKLIEKLKIYANTIHNELTSNNEDLKLSYQGYTADSVEKLEKLLLEKLEENIEKDIKLGFTTVGPHRDDIKIEANGIDLRSFGSQGQQRTVSLSLKLAELEVFNENLGEYPVLLLDDVLSELDENRQNKLLSYISNIQTILTCTDFSFDIPHTKYYISNGSLSYSEKH